MDTSTSKRQLDVQPVRSLSDLPNELLLHILSSIDPHAGERVLGHIPDDPPPSLPDPYLVEDFLECNRPLCSLALASRRFRDIAQERLLFAPVIGGFTFRSGGSPDRSRSRIAYLLRTLFARPDLRRHVRQIRLCFPPFDNFSDRTDGKDESNMRAEPLDFADIVRQSRETVASLNLPQDMKKTMSVQLIMDFRHTMMGILMALLPQLELLSFSDHAPESLPRWRLDDYHSRPNLAGIRPNDHTAVDLQGLQCLPVINTLRRVKVSSLSMLRLDGLNMFPKVDTLDISMKLAGCDINLVNDLKRLFSERRAHTNFQGIRHLRIDCQVKTVGIWDFAARSCLNHLLSAFPQLKILDYYAEPSSEKNPYRSVRAFPHYQANIQKYPDENPSMHTGTAIESTYWDERIYNARTQFTDYQYLVDSLVNVRRRLESLRFPGGFWTLPGAMRKPLPRFQLFPFLHTLVLPQAAILSIKLDNMRYPEVVKGDFELLPTHVLPPKLRFLSLFDADAELLQSAWLRELFDQQATCNHWPELKKLEVLFGPNFDNADLGDLLGRKTWDHIWEFVDEANFEVIIGRDDGVPAVCSIS